MPCAASDAAKAPLLKWGEKRDMGAERTSARAVAPAPSSSAMKRSSGCLVPDGQDCRCLSIKSHSSCPAEVPGIHEFVDNQDVDGRDKPGHDRASQAALV
jgi:hypothetical protein